MGYWRRSFFVAFAAIHLSIVSFFAFASNADVRLATRTGPLGSMIESIVVFYANWSGVGTAYSYFAPRVAEMTRTRFRILHASGEISEHTLAVSQFEIELRIAGLGRTAGRADAHVLFARSFSALAFFQVPDAKQVTVIFEDYILPDFEEALANEHATWTPTYSADFVRSGDEIVCLC